VVVLASAAAVFSALVGVGMIVAAHWAGDGRQIEPSKMSARIQLDKREVSVDNFTFSPQTLSVSVGTMVTWTNRDDVPHTVVDTERRFKSSTLDTDDTFSRTFVTAGEYTYYCGIHPHMTGKIVVQ
jgi:plastocyanin